MRFSLFVCAIFFAFCLNVHAFYGDMKQELRADFKKDHNSIKVLIATNVGLVFRSNSANPKSNRIEGIAYFYGEDILEVEKLAKNNRVRVIYYGGYLNGEDSIQPASASRMNVRVGRWDAGNKDRDLRECKKVDEDFMDCIEVIHSQCTDSSKVAKLVGMVDCERK